MSEFRKLLSSLFVKERFHGRGNLGVLSCTKGNTRFSDSLYNRLRTCYEQRSSVIPVLDKWILEGRVVDYKELFGIIRTFRKDRDFKTALGIAEWVSKMKHFNVTAGDAAIQLDLISKIHGVEQAENYFNGLENRLRALSVYGALLNCYADAKSLEKAEATMEVVRKLDGDKCLCYRVMLSLYSKLGKHNKMEELMQEMEEKGIVYNDMTYNIILHAYGSRSDVEGMEKVLKKMLADPTVTMTFSTYTTAAHGYTTAGASEKALAMLKQAEYLTKDEERKNAYRVIITLYATLKKKEDVHRLWDALQNNEKLYNKNCKCMLSSLVKLDDLVSAEKILEEYEEKTVHFDIRVPNTVISAYCRQGHVKEAESILNRLVENGKKPSATTWSYMSLGYCKNALMNKAIEMTKKAILVSFPEWEPDLATIAACLEHLKNEGNTEEMEEILMLLEKQGKLESGFMERIERYACEGSQAQLSSEVCWFSSQRSSI